MGFTHGQPCITGRQRPGCVKLSGTRCVRVDISHQGHTRGPLSYKSNWKGADGRKGERQDSYELEVSPYLFRTGILIISIN